MKYPYYVMKIMAIWNTLDELDGAKTRREFTDSSGAKHTNIFTYLHPVGIYLKYQHKIDHNHNWRYVPIFLDRK